MTRKTYIAILVVALATYPLTWLFAVGQVVFLATACAFIFANWARGKSTGRRLTALVSSGSWFVGGLLGQAFALNFKTHLLSGIGLDVAGGGTVLLTGLACLTGLSMSRDEKTEPKLR